MVVVTGHLPHSSFFLQNIPSPRPCLVTRGKTDVERGRDRTSTSTPSGSRISQEQATAWVAGAPDFSEASCRSQGDRGEASRWGLRFFGVLQVGRTFLEGSIIKLPQAWPSTGPVHRHLIPHPCFRCWRSSLLQEAALQPKALSAICFLSHLCLTNHMAPVDRSALLQPRPRPPC